MGFDGIPRPAQVNPYTDPLNPYLASNAARSEQAGKPLVRSPNGEEKIKALQKEQREHRQPDDEDEQQGETFSEEEAREVLLFARMRGVMNTSVEAGVRYEFRINEATGMVDLVEADSGNMVMQLLPEELTELSRKIQRYAGMLTDKAG